MSRTERYIHQVFAPTLGERWENSQLVQAFAPVIDRLDLEEEDRKKLRDFVRVQLVGERARYSLTEDWTALGSFESRASVYERAAEKAIAALAEEIVPVAEAAGVTFDAVLTTTATGNLMPGLSYRMARRLGEQVRRDSMLLDLGNVGCTGSSKLLNLVRSLDPAIRNALLVSVEVPSTLVDVSGPAQDLWQGNCTFGDGAAALWVSTDVEQGPGALHLEDVNYRQKSADGFDLIRWRYRDYYAFALGDAQTFDQEVRRHVAEVLSETEEHWKDEPRWAIHPAGILILVRISRKLGIPTSSIQPSADHYRRYSNMSSASILHVIRDLWQDTPVDGAINLLTMGAGFNVIYGRIRRVR